MKNLTIKDGGITCNTADLPELLTVKELEKLLKLSTPRVYELIHSKGFPTVIIGKNYRIDKRKLMRMIDDGFII